ncbi:hypothetical protein A2331_00315 [Candidatus Falkowbacteria bacterium RIFOXYB2_FULL_34_18]|uniref:CAAX prenyl protease 2/Lysostaphin resistance protein A-like domain-containing protein n=1 Tax=Candidatus Falkowbacteria bacterium RIFOXYD2_FULL_34_120 TaxID=1798007 RepID=A0A1F5TQ71_9BACT|nr:MAG: hypothetical protein A2331_00315 [Candidatus Falkowbacteria bacterium RIFOXYB2_FULL_34_18]OGF29011.1 MAG: hypothetical protein A2500_02650 [Candidatus Falkowbacteria bacterium RIFOXYC12_FULL_34_55]OGF35972.1 MAG: hypothetical protein A2466_01675 [Candidatus Falkowbacteria bacterium RIFOXYC2_FULL_34_220]OGF38518.1 MAG: hypothetical protein A2515_07200 [Candidatus Falkowbacteria bacterium RIFOXYD12_FULL_34_57]OGF40681.1 MAG: hypothetical protein A2531_03420 [Candidatus Falkowbacteria bact
MENLQYFNPLKIGGALDKFIYWLQEEIKGRRVPIFILKILIIDMIYCLFCLIILFFTDNIFSKSGQHGNISILSYSFPFVVFMLAFLEEIIFRLPLSFFVKFSTPKTVLCFAIILSAIFGYLHGGILNIVATQGVGGFLICIVYLKCGGFQGKTLKPLICSTCMHALYNLTFAYSLALLGLKYM